MAKNIRDIDGIDDGIRLIVELKSALIGAQQGVTVVGPRLAYLVSLTWELAGVDAEEANNYGGETARDINRAIEHLDALLNILKTVGGQVARAVRAAEEAEARRKVLAGKTGTTRGRGAAASTINV